MLDYFWIDNQEAAFLSALGLDRVDRLMSGQLGQPVARGHRHRETMRIAADSSAPHARAVFLKRELQTPLKYLGWHLAGGRGYWTKARSEFEILRRLRDANVLCPKPLLCHQSGLWNPRGCLLLDDLQDTVPMNQFLAASHWEEGSPARERFFSGLGQAVANLHATGIDQPDLYVIHIHVAPRDGRWQFAFLDFQRSIARSELSLVTRARDLGALLATLPDRLATRQDKEALFETYLSAAEIEHKAAALAHLAQKRIDQLLTRRKIWEIRESDTARHLSAPCVDQAEQEPLWIDRQFRPNLERRGLGSFEALMATTEGEQLRALKDRENWRIRVDAGDSPPRLAYLKKHHIRGLRPWLRAKLGLGPGETPGRVEARNVSNLARGGIAAMRLIAFGEKLHPNGLLESLVLTEALDGFEQLDHFLRRRFPRLQDKATHQDPDLNRLIREVALVAGRFHRLGYNHRDLYCCHFFIREQRPGTFEVHLIDLQRVEHRRLLRGRWLVKDLAQLSYSAPRDRVTTARQLAFFKSYLGIRKLRNCDKRLIRRILAKRCVMERSLGAHP